MSLNIVPDLVKMKVAPENHVEIKEELVTPKNLETKGAAVASTTTPPPKSEDFLSEPKSLPGDNADGEPFLTLITNGREAHAAGSEPQARIDSDDEPLIRADKLSPAQKRRKRDDDCKDDDEMGDEGDPECDDQVLATLKQIVSIEENDDNLEPGSSTSASTSASSTAAVQKNGEAAPPLKLKASGFSGEYWSLNGLWTATKIDQVGARRQGGANVPGRSMYKETYLRNHGQIVYHKFNFYPRRRTIYLYYCDDRASKEDRGWWIGEQIGGDNVWFFNDLRFGLPETYVGPPRHGWRPYTYKGRVEPRIDIYPVDSMRCMSEIQNLVQEQERLHKMKFEEEQESKKTPPAETAALYKTFKEKREERKIGWIEQLQKWEDLRQRKKMKDLHLRPDMWRFREVRDDEPDDADSLEAELMDFNVEKALGEGLSTQNLPQQDAENKEVIDGIRKRLDAILSSIDEEEEEEDLDMEEEKESIKPGAMKKSAMKKSAMKKSAMKKNGMKKSAMKKK